MTRTPVAIALAASLVAALPVAAHAEVPVRIRVIKGSRQAPARVDPRLDDLKRQLSPLAYLRWDQVAEQRIELARGKTEFVSLPGSGDLVGVTLQERRGDTVTIEVALAARNTQSRLTIQKGQRIVHQVSGEERGAAFFLTVTAWP